MLKNLENKKGFTLVELIIVIAILAIIMLIAIPNFSGIQQRMQVRADKSTAAQIGKAARIWYTEFNSDPAFKAGITVCLPTPTTGSAADDLDTNPGVMVELKDLSKISDYVDNTLEPNSLRLDGGAIDPDQKYYLGIVGSGSYEKIVVCIANAAPTLPANAADAAEEGQSGLSVEEDVQYDGNVNNGGAEGAAEFEKALAYLES